MQKIKTVGFAALLTAVMTAAVIGISYAAAPRFSPSAIQEGQRQTQELLSEKILNAEASLNAMAAELGTDEKLATELDSVRQLLVASSNPAEVKKANSKWNERVFNTLVSWKSEQTALASRGRSARVAATKQPRGNAAGASRVSSWWQRSPDLVLAFAEVPVTDGSQSAILVGEGAEGKLLKAGKRYDADIEPLRIVQETGAAVSGIFPWEDKMYYAVATPVLKDASRIGIAVVGMELSRLSLANFGSPLPEHTSLILYYARDDAGKKDFRYSAPDTLQSMSALRDADFVRFTEFDKGGAAVIHLEDAVADETYVGEVADNLTVISRTKWLWDPAQEAGFIVVSDMNDADRAWGSFRRNVMIAGLFFLLFGAVGAFLLGRNADKKLLKIKHALLEAINSGNPIDADAFAAIPGIADATLDHYVIRPIDDGSDDASTKLEDLLDDLEDVAAPPTDKSIAMLPAISTPEEQREFGELYKSYMEKRRETGVTEEMPYDLFERRMKRNIEKIRATHPNANVHFTAAIQNGKAVLSPQLVKK